MKTVNENMNREVKVVIDVSLLRQQRDAMLRIKPEPNDSDNVDGIINLLDAMLDLSEDWQNLTT